MATWTRKPQEQAEKYYFDGRAVMTAGVARELSPEDVAFIYAALMVAVLEEDGLDYLQVYASDDGRVVWCLCQLNLSMKASGEYGPEDDVWTMLLPSEY